MIDTISYASLAQSVEHAAVNRGVVGSSPTGGANSGIAAAMAAIPIKIRHYGPLAQLVEHPAHNRSVRGSSP